MTLENILSPEKIITIDSDSENNSANTQMFNFHFQDEFMAKQSYA